MANIVVPVATNVAKYFEGPAIREVQCIFCVNKVINDLEDKKEALKSERDNLQTRIEQARARTEVIEKPVEKWVNDAGNLLREVEVLVERTERDNHCCQGWFPTWGRYVMCKQMVEKTVAMGNFIGKSNDIHPFSHLAPLPGIQYQSSKDFIYFESTKMAYNQLLEALEDDGISVIGLYGMSGCGKTTLVTEVGKKAEELDMFDKVISITVTRTPDIRGIQEKMADMLNLELNEKSEEGRAQRLWLCLQQKKRILIIVDDLWREFHLMNIGILLDNVKEHTWKVLITTCNEHVCTSMDCQKTIHLGLLSEDESWTLFQKFARIDDEYSKLLDGVPRKVCNECNGLPLSIKTTGSSLKGRHEIEWWQQAFDKLRDSKASDDEGGVRTTLSCLKLSYDYLQRQHAQLLLMICTLFPEDYHIPTEDLMRFAFGLGVGERLSLQSMRSLIQADINKLLDSCLLSLGSVKMHDMVRETVLWIANTSDNCKILVNVDKPLSTVAEDNKIRDCFALSSWWYNENPTFCQLHAPKLKMLLVNISARGSLNSLDLSHLTFEGVQGLEVLSITIDNKIVPVSFSPSIQLLTNVRTLRLNGLKFGDISFIGSLTSLEVLDLRRCNFNELPIEIGKLLSLKLLDLSECHISENNYNEAIGKCSQLEELYASACYPETYVHEIILDIGILSNLQRFVLDDQILQERRGVLRVKDFNISKLRTSKKNILQIAEIISLEGLHGGCKNIIPDMVGGLNDLTSLNLTSCQEIECIFDATYDFKEDDLIPRLVELRLQSMDNLTELYRGPPLQILRYFEKLELLDIQFCWKLHSIFPRECKLQNLKILSLSNSRTDEVLFTASVAQCMQQLEQLKISGCTELKHIIGECGSEHGDCSTSQEIVPTPTNSRFLMTNLRDVNILNCQSLESIFPICYVEGLTQLQKMEIVNSPKLKYVFREYDLEYLSSHEYHNHVMLPHLDVLSLIGLDNFMGICPAYCHAMWPSQFLRRLLIGGCPKLDTPWFDLKAGYDDSQHRLTEIIPSKLQQLALSEMPQLNSVSLVGPAPRQSWSFQCLLRLTLTKCEELKCLFSMETHRILPELMELRVYDCQELEKIVAADEELVQLPNAELCFPELKLIEVRNCNKLKSLFPFSMVRMLPQLSTLEIKESTQLEDVFSLGPRDDTISKREVVLPNLTEISFDDLPNFVDVCHGCKLHAVKLLELRILRCPKYAPRHKIRMKLKEAEDEDVHPFSHHAPLPGISYQSFEDFIYFESTKVAYNQLLEVLEDDGISVIGLYGMRGCGKTTLVTEVGKKAEELEMFDKVISITVSRTPNIRSIQGEIADMLNLKLSEESEEGRAQRLWLRLKEKKSILVIVDDLWREFDLRYIGIHLDNFDRRTWKILVVTRNEQLCTLMDCQKKIHLGLLSEDESWTLFQKFARIDDKYSMSLDGVPQKICNECNGLPLAIKIFGTSLKGRSDIEWLQTFDKLMDSEASNDEGEVNNALRFLKLSDDYLPRQQAQLLSLIDSLFLKDYRPTIEELGMLYDFMM